MSTLLNTLRTRLNKAYRQNEDEILNILIPAAQLNPIQLANVEEQAKKLVLEIREKRSRQGGLDALLQQYDLSDEEGIALMCLAEAMLRVPDKATADKLIADKLAMADWAQHAGQSKSFFVNAATWGLMLSSSLLKPIDPDTNRLNSTLKNFLQKSSAPVIRTAVGHMMKVLGEHFVMGETIEAALKRGEEMQPQGYTFSFDMLGEAARTQADADRYFASYQQAITAIANASHGKSVVQSSGISIKLSALYPRYEYAKHHEAVAALIPILKTLALQAKVADISLTVDAEEADRLELSLDIISAVFCDAELGQWEGFGLAVQSYQKRAFYLIDWLAELATQQKKRWFIRLIKGAYWDSEIKISQVGGFEGYPVFTRKIATDVSFLACAKKILAAPQAFYGQFATHNAFSVAAILELAEGRSDFEFQCLHGMGYTLYDQVLIDTNKRIPCRVYAPVGGHEDLLAYLVRRLLENGANSSFVNRIMDKSIPVEEIVQDPVKRLAHMQPKANPKIPLPRNVYGAARLNSQGLDFSNSDEFLAMQEGYKLAAKKAWHAKPTLANADEMEAAQAVQSPNSHQQVVGEIQLAKADFISKALDKACEAQNPWARLVFEKRAAILRKAADLLEAKRFDFMWLATYEAGKTLGDANSEVREAIDFCRYYAEQAEELFKPQMMPGPTGESNQLSLHGRGVMVCISPWNFPLAIFMGQITAALVAGNAVIAKPATQTPLIAAAAVELLHEAGVPAEVLQLLPASGRLIGQQLLVDPRVAGVIFTGSTETAWQINQTLANRRCAIAPLIAETGGQNAMIVDSSALPEQVIADVVTSAFGSAGQRCSALRVLFLQEDIADKMITMLKGAMATLSIGHPAHLDTDIGPVIDEAAKKELLAHRDQMEQKAKLLFEVPLSAELTKEGSYLAPCAFELPNLQLLTQEVFGPMLHVIRYKAENLDDVIAQINHTGYGLTLGIHSRIDSVVRHIVQNVCVGNIYVNRNMIGAVVGVQPFGGEGLSGTGPKAGGPNYLRRLCTERTLTINTTAAGGNASLMATIDEEA